MFFFPLQLLQAFTIPHQDKQTFILTISFYSFFHFDNVAISFPFYCVLGSSPSSVTAEELPAIKHDSYDIKASSVTG